MEISLSLSLNRLEWIKQQSSQQIAHSTKNIEEIVKNRCWTTLMHVYEMRERECECNTSLNRREFLIPPAILHSLSLNDIWDIFIFFILWLFNIFERSSSQHPKAQHFVESFSPVPVFVSLARSLKHYWRPWNYIYVKSAEGPSTIPQWNVAEKKNKKKITREWEKRTKMPCDV